jgi:glycosyltransferase involved in cell wall biosynthesis
MNYLLITEYFPESEEAEFTGGIEARCFYFVKEMSKRHNITVLCSHLQGQRRVSKVFNAKVIRCGPTTKYSNQGCVLSRLSTAVSFYSQGWKIKNIDIVEGSSFLTYLPAYFLANKLKAKKVATWHETWIGEWIKNKGFPVGFFGSVWERIATKLNWDLIVSVSTFTKKRLMRKGVEKNKILIFPNGIESKQFQLIKAKKHKEPTICYFGRINGPKNLDLLIKAVSIIRKKNKNVKCKILGSGPALTDLKKLVKKLRLKNHVTFTGRIENFEDYLKEAKKCQIYVHPSTLEGFGITVLEALSLNLPYVITNIAPFIEVTKNGRGGLIFKQNNLKELVEKITKLLNDKKLYLKKINEGQTLLKEYDWKTIINKYEESILCLLRK